MALIFAFRDEGGHWYGRPQAEIDYGPFEGALTLDPADWPDEQGRRSPFVGQRLEIRYGGIEDGPGFGGYVRLDSGYRLFATATVDDLLFLPRGQSGSDVL